MQSPHFDYRFLVFGGTGAIGSALVTAGVERGWTVIPTARTLRAINGITPIRVDPFADESYGEMLAEHGPYAGICWAQGSNLNDNIFNVNIDRHLDLYKANCLFVLATLKVLLERRLLTRPSRLCVISSIWQTLARQDKLSYCVSKSALQGLVSSASTDLAAEGHLFNAVLPGALDTPMTRRLLSPEQIARLKAATKFCSLSAIRDVASLVMFLCSSENTGITGQFIAVDLGFSRVHLL